MKIWFAGQRIDGLPPRRRLELGLVHVPEGKRLFPRMSVRENLELGAFLRRDASEVNADIEANYARFPILQSLVWPEFFGRRHIGSIRDRLAILAW